MELSFVNEADPNGRAFRDSQSDISRKIQVNEDLVLEEIEEDVIVGTHRFPWAGNCLAVLIPPSELVLVDTPWELTGTKALLQWLRERFGRIHIIAINTHFHQDNLGGNGILLSRGIPVYGSDLTVRLLEEKGDSLVHRTLENLSDSKYKRYFDAYKNLELEAPDHIFELKKGLTLQIGQEDIEIFHPGPAHTMDNVVVYFPKRKILFGGCLIRSLESKGISPPSDGDLDSWPLSAKNVLDRFPEARIVIPGHGTWGDTSLIQHTIDIANQSLQRSDFPALKGPYLGQKPPGIKPEVFSPGIISTQDNNEALFCAYMDEDNLFLFTRSSPGASGQVYYPIFVTELKDGTWTRPYLASFHNKPCDQNLSIVPDGKTLYFGSRRSLDGKGESPEGFNIWVVKRTAEGFSNPRMLDPPVNSDDYDICPSVSKDGTLYFFSERSGGFGRADIYLSRLVDGRYTGVENIGQPVNTENSEIDPFISADESYLIYCSQTLSGFGGHDLYITFRKQDGSWTEPVNMGQGINSPGNDWIPYVTSDGKYFFFVSNRTGDDDIYWVDAKIIEDLRPKKW